MAANKFSTFFLFNTLILLIFLGHVIDCAKEEDNGRKSDHTERPIKPKNCTNPRHNNDRLGNYNFYPVSSIVGIVFVGIWFAFVAIAKIMYNSTDQYKINNRFDLVIFKPATKNSLIGPRRIYGNNNVNIQNINAANASGMDLSFLYHRNPSTSAQSLHR